MTIYDPNLFAYHQIFGFDDMEVHVVALHTLSRRLPRPHQIIKQLACGLRLKMEEEIKYEWAIYSGHQRSQALRRGRDGCYYLSNQRPRFQTIEDAARAYLEASNRQSLSPQPG